MRGCMQLPLLTKLLFGLQQTGPLPQGLGRWQVYEKRPGMMGKKLFVHYARTLKNLKALKSAGPDKIPAHHLYLVHILVSLLWDVC